MHKTHNKSCDTEEKFTRFFKSIEQYMFITKVSPRYFKKNKDSSSSKYDEEEFNDRYDVAKHYVHHVLKIINGSCDQKTRY